MLKIYGANLSYPANKVRMAANELGVKYEYTQINLREGEHQKPEYLALHPAGKVPVIDDDGFVLFESDAIIRYLATKQSSPLYPQDIKKRAIVDQWMSFSSIHIGAAMARVMFNRVFAPILGVPADENSLKDGLKFLDRFLPVVNNQLGKTQFIAGNELTVADISLIATLDPAEVAEIDLSKYPNIVKWRSELKKKDFYTKCHTSYEEAFKNIMAKAS